MGSPFGRGGRRAGKPVVTGIGGVHGGQAPVAQERGEGREPPTPGDMMGGKHSEKRSAGASG